MKQPNEQRLSDSALRLRAVIDTAIDGIITIDEHGVVETINPAAARLFGYEKEDVIGRKINMLMPEPYRTEHDGYLERYHRTGHPHIIGIGREVEGLKKDGTIFPLRLAVSEVWLEERRIYTGIIHDLTDVKAAEARVLELNRQLEAKVENRTEELARVVDRLLATNRQLSNEVTERLAAEHALNDREAELREALEKEKELNLLKSRFVSMASHEFRTPLSTILSSIELIEMYQREDQQERRTKHIKRIKDTVGNLNDILHDFLSLSRLEEGRLEAKPEWFNLESFCDDLYDDLKVLLKEGQQLHLHKTGTDREVWLDRTFLRNVITNLMSNAVKYSDEGKSIFCTVEVNGELLTLGIKDEGIGIPEQDQAHLFTRFFRAHNVENIKGTGLGLHIVRRYVDLLGGTVSFESREGRGSTFSVVLPLSGAKESYH